MGNITKEIMMTRLSLYINRELKNSSHDKMFMEFLKAGSEMLRHRSFDELKKWTQEAPERPHDVPYCELMAYWKYGLLSEEMGDDCGQPTNIHVFFIVIEGDPYEYRPHVPMVFGSTREKAIEFGREAVRRLGNTCYSRSTDYGMDEHGNDQNERIKKELDRLFVEFSTELDGIDDPGDMLQSLNKHISRIGKVKYCNSKYAGGYACVWAHSEWVDAYIREIPLDVVDMKIGKYN